MSEINPEIEAPEVSVPEVPVPELRYEYQPTDEQGRPLGGKQVILYRTPDELAQKLSAQNTELIRKLRSVTKEHRLGIKSDEHIPDDAERFNGLIELKPRELSAQERYEISQELNDPEKFVDARDRLLESAIGASPAQLTQILNETQMFQLQMRARDNYVTFVKSDAGKSYSDNPENRDMVTNWMLKNNLAPVVKNFIFASNTLKEAGLLLDAPVVHQEPTPPAPATPVAAPVEIVDTTVNPQPSVEPAGRIASPAQPQAKRQGHVPSGLNDRVSSSAGVASTPTNTGDGLSMSLADIDKLSADQLRPLLSKPEFRKHYDGLLDEAAKKRKDFQPV